MILINYIIKVFSLYNVSLCDVIKSQVCSNEPLEQFVTWTAQISCLILHDTRLDRIPLYLWSNLYYWRQYRVSFSTLQPLSSWQRWTFHIIEATISCYNFLYHLVIWDVNLWVNGTIFCLLLNTRYWNQVQLSTTYSFPVNFFE